MNVLLLAPMLVKMYVVFAVILYPLPTVIVELPTAIVELPTAIVELLGAGSLPAEFFNNGQKWYSILAHETDLHGTLPPGMRLLEYQLRNCIRCVL